MERRDFLKYGGVSVAALVIGSQLDWLLKDPAYAAVPVQTVTLDITDTLKDMVTHNAGNPAQCYYWAYKSVSPSLDADCPGPIIFTSTFTPVTFVITNKLDAFHALSVPALGLTTGPIAPGATVTKTFTPVQAGTYLYYDDLNAPVNRMMGLHGAFIVMPRQATQLNSGAKLIHRVTPYDKPGPNVQRLFDDLGKPGASAGWWPGLAWEEGDTSTDTPAFRQNIWVLHEASPNLFWAVGDNSVISFTTTSGKFISGSARDPNVFTQAFLESAFEPAHDPFSPSSSNFVPQYFTISGQSGHFSHNNPWICPYSRVGEPYLIRVLNAGMWLHSTHIHANHVFVLSHNMSLNNFGDDPFPGSRDNPIWIDVYTANPLDTYDWLVPYMRPPDVPNDLGIGRDDLEQSLDVKNTAVPMPGYGIAPGGPPYNPANIPANPDNLYEPGTHKTWPPIQELNTFIPNVGSVTGMAQDEVTPIDCAVRLSPICFPMHDHSEPSQVSQGGNYNCGMISGIIFTGDRKGARPGQTSKVHTYPDRPTTGDPMTPVSHGPDYTKGYAQPPTVPFKMPSLP